MPIICFPINLHVINTIKFNQNLISQKEKKIELILNSKYFMYWFVIVLTKSAKIVYFNLINKFIFILNF